MRRSLIALSVAALLACPAAAQVPYPAGPTNQSNLALIAPTAPAADNSNRIATTSWVNGFLASNTPLASGKIWIGSVGNVATPQTPSGDWTINNAGVTTLATVNGNVGAFGSATLCATVTVNAKGLITAASAATCTPAVGSITGLAANMATWLATPSSANLRAALTDETGTGLAYFQGGDIGTPSAGVGTNLTSLNATQLTAGTVPAARTNGHQNGTATNDSAAAGEIGEVMQASVAVGSAAALTNNTSLTITSITLTAGEWDVFAAGGFIPAATTSVTQLTASISTTTNTLDTTTQFALSRISTAAQVPAGLDSYIIAGPVRFQVATTQQVFIVVRGLFTVSTMTAYGSIRARRVR